MKTNSLLLKLHNLDAASEPVVQMTGDNTSVQEEDSEDAIEEVTGAILPTISLTWLNNM